MLCSFFRYYAFLAEASGSLIPFPPLPHISIPRFWQNSHSCANPHIHHHAIVLLTFIQQLPPLTLLSGLFRCFYTPEFGPTNGPTALCAVHYFLPCATIAARCSLYVTTLTYPTQCPSASIQSFVNISLLTLSYNTSANETL
jgi:hypothetical protein